MEKKRVAPPDRTFMIVNIDEDGVVINATDKDGNLADSKDPFPYTLKKPVPIGLKRVHPHSVFGYQKSPTNCVTYYYPGGSWTV